MAKCSICNSRKGKRNCVLTSAVVCSQCCGEARGKPECKGCPFLRSEKDLRRYDRVPRFSVQKMDSDSELAEYSYSIEGALCVWDSHHDGHLSDGMALKVLEMLLDKYHFGDTEVPTTDKLILEGYETVVDAIGQDLPEVPTETLVSILGVIYFVAKRRSQGRRDYFEVIHQYVGLRAGPGVRVLRHWNP